MGMSDIENMDITLGSSSAYTVDVNNSELGQYTKSHKFIETISTTLNVMDSLVVMDLNLASQYKTNNEYTTKAYTLYDGSSYGATYGNKYMRTNEYYRQQYLNSIVA